MKGVAETLQLAGSNHFAGVGAARTLGGGVPEGGARQEHQTHRVRSPRWHRRPSRLQPTAWPSAVARLLWLVISASAEGLSIAQIADRLGRSPATVKAYFYDPTGEKARAVKARYEGVCRGCGAYTQPRNGKGDAYAYCKACHPGAIERRWTRERVLDAIAHGGHGTAGCRRPTTGRDARAPAWGRGARATQRGDWPSPGVVTGVYGSWEAARAAAAERDIDDGNAALGEARRRRPST